MTAGSVIALSLLCTSVSSAAPGPRRNIVGRACSPHSSPVYKLARRSKSSGGPVVLPSKQVRSGLTDITTRLKRSTRAKLADDDLAIQCDTSAARIEGDDRPAPAFRPLGVLLGSFDPLPPPHIFSPRSTRGPPIPN